MNVVIKNNKKYLYESFWRKRLRTRPRSHSDKSALSDNIKSGDQQIILDSEGNKFKIPKKNNVYWQDKISFIEKLNFIQYYLKNNGKYNNRLDEYCNERCVICNKKITRGTYNLNNIIWENGLIHYIKVHNVIPSNEFIDIIYNFTPIIKNKSMKYKSDIYQINNIKYVRLERNQIMIIDAVMKHGGYSQKYFFDSGKSTNSKNMYKYSEHAGILDFNNQGLDKIIISGKSNRIDGDDLDIFLPKNMAKAYEYEYIFHTHPPTPKPGGRVSSGILYEFPSVSDIFHFLDHYNSGNTIGSLVITPEGLYNIRTLVFHEKTYQISLDEEKLYDEMQNIMRQAQKIAIKKYGIHFSTYEFYSRISQNRTYINMINKVLKKFDLTIDYYSRTKDDKGNWVIDLIHLPIYA